VEGAHGRLTVAETARRLDRSTEQVRRYLRENRLSGERVGGQWFIDAAEVEAFAVALNAEPGFLDRIVPASESDPLVRVIGIGAGGGKSNMADGKEAYRRAFWWRR